MKTVAKWAILSYLKVRLCGVSSPTYQRKGSDDRRYEQTVSYRPLSCCGLRKVPPGFL